MTAQDWRDSAVCAQVDDELFYPATGQSTRAAMRVCAACPVAAECLEAAMVEEDDRDTSHGFRYGIRGGLSASARTRLGRERRDAATTGEAA